MTFLKRIVVGTALLLGYGQIASPAQAGYVVTFKEVGNDVVATGSGPIDLTGLSPLGSPGFAAQGVLAPASMILATGPTEFTPVDLYTSANVDAFQQFGTGLAAYPADSGSGDIVGITEAILYPTGGAAIFQVPAGYVSGNLLSDTSTYANQTFGSLGLTPGTYVWSWGTGNQSFTLIIGASAAPGPPPSPVPEPASAALLGVALAGLLLAGTMRRIQNGA
jgi:hypothetical protein